MMPLLPWNAQQSVNTTTSGAQERPHIAQLTNGNMVVSWVDYSTGDGNIKFQIYDPLGNKIGSETLAHGASGSNQAYCDVAFLTTGGFVISYVDIEGNTLFGQKFTAPGVMDGGAIVLSNPALTQIDLLTNPPVLQSMLNGEFAVIYTTNNFVQAASGLDLVGRIVTAASVPQAAFAASPLIGDAQYSPASAMGSDGGLFIVSIGKVTPGSGGSVVNEIFGRYVTSSGLTVANFNITSTPAGEQAPSVTALSNGNFLVSWSVLVDGVSSSDIRGKIFSKLGVAQSSEFKISTSSLGEQLYSQVSGLADGKFIAFYQTSAAINEVLRAQMFNSDGTPFGGELTVSSNGQPSYAFPDAVTLSDGRVALVWPNIDIDGPNTGISLQILDPREGVYTGTANADQAWGHDGNVDFMTGNAGADILYGLRGNDTLYGDAGNDTLNGGRGDDTLFGGADQDSLLGGLGADEMDGGDGVDTANYALATFAITASLDGTLLGSNEALDDTYINIENLTGTNIATQGDTLRGNAAGNSIAGLAGADTLNGVSGHDRLTGGAGVDTMTGGVGNDSFIYNTLTEGGDIITDFSSFAANNDDVFRLKGSVFGGLASGAIAVLQFQSSTADVAANTNVRFFYETDTRILRFDADGSGAGASVIIATLQAGATMTFNDILMF